MANVRTEIIGGIWADGAPDVSPGVSPTPLVTYGKSALTSGQMTTGWPYSQIVDSATFNEAMRRITTLLQLMEEYGVLPWCAATTYKTGGLVVASDDFLYQALSDNTNQNPVSTTAYWRRLRGLSSAGIGVYNAGATLTLADFGRAITYNSSSPGTLILPSIIASPLGSIISIANINTGACTIQRAGSATIYALGHSGVNSIVLQYGDSIALMTDATNWEQVSGCDVTLSKYLNSTSGLHESQTQPDGRIIKCGAVNSADTGASLALAFPVAFPNLIQSLVLTAWQAQGVTAVYTHEGKSTSGANVYRGGSATSYQYDYIAMGY